MPLAYFVMLCVAFGIIYFLTKSDKPKIKDELQNMVEDKVLDYHKKVELKDKLNTIDQGQLDEAEFKLKKLKEEKQNKKEN